MGQCCWRLPHSPWGVCRSGQAHWSIHDPQRRQFKLARTVIRLPEANTRDTVALCKVRATPWDLHRPRELEVTLKDRSDEKKEDHFEEGIAGAPRLHLAQRISRSTG